MIFYSNLSRVFRLNKLLQNQREKWQRKRYIVPKRYQRSIIRSIKNFESSKGTVKAIFLLSYKPRYRRQIYEHNLLVKDAECESLFNIVLIVARIFVISSVLTGLAVVYFITRFTQRHMFPIILRKSNYSPVKEKHISI